MKNKRKEILVFLSLFGAIPFLFFYSFLFCIVIYHDAIVFPLFVVLPVMWLCFYRIEKYLPIKIRKMMTKRGIENRKMKSNKEMMIESVMWYSVVLAFNYHMYVKSDMLNFQEVYGFHILYGILGGIVASVVGGVVLLFVAENMRSLIDELIPEQWRKIRSRLSSVFIAYISVIFFFSGIYMWIYVNDPSSFSSPIESSFDAVYFSVVTITTLGYGDIAPVTDLPRMVAIVQTLLGILFLAVMIGFVISISSVDRERVSNGDDNDKIKNADH